MNESPERKGAKRAVFLLPNLVTTLALFSGFYSVVATLDGKYGAAAVAILVAALFDSLDGRIARMTRTASKFGVQYDSLSDLLAFGMAPALLIYTAYLKPYGRLGWLAAFIFLACGALRLARFNVEQSKGEMKSFTGLPIPAAASLVGSGMFLVTENRWEDKAGGWWLIPLIYALAFLMVSNIAYPGFKQVMLPRRGAFRALAGVVLVLVLIATFPEWVLFLLSLSYVALGPLLGNWLLKKLGGSPEELEARFALEDEDILEEGNGEEWDHERGN